MTKHNYTTLLAAFFIAGVASASPAAAQENTCLDAPSAAAKVLPSPLRKWAQITCTPSGQMLSSRDGWVWASLKDAAQIAIGAGTPPDGPDDVGNPSYFTAIEVDELHQDELTAALATFDSGMKLNEAGSKVYRVDLNIASGGVANFLFFDFGTFAGGMLCPDKNCAQDTRFLIMQQENKDQISVAYRP